MAQATASALLGVLVLSCIVGVVSRRRKLEKAILRNSVLVYCVSVRIIAVGMEVSRQSYMEYMESFP